MKTSKTKARIGRPDLNISGMKELASAVITLAVKDYYGVELALKRFEDPHTRFWWVRRRATTIYRNRQRDARRTKKLKMPSRRGAIETAVAEMGKYLKAGRRVLAETEEFLQTESFWSLVLDLDMESFWKGVSAKGQADRVEMATFVALPNLPGMTGEAYFQSRHAD